jgi:hypothetical protein
MDDKRADLKNGKSALATHKLFILKVVWPLAPRKFVICLRNLYNENIPMMSGCILILAQNTCRMTHLLACPNSLQMRSRAFSGPNGIPPIILKNCASASAKPLSLHFNRYMATSVFPTGGRFHMLL